MFHPFDSAKALYNRAVEHLIELRSIEQRWLQNNAEGPFVEPDDKIRYDTVRFRFKTGIPIEYSVVLFEIIQCLRSSLDHATFDASRVLGGKPKPKSTKFPFGKTKRAAEADLPRKRAEVPDSIRPFLLSFRPYQRGNRTLWGLNEIRNTKIHQHLRVMSTCSNGVGLEHAIGEYVELHTVSVWDRRKNELTALRIRCSPDTKLNLNFSPYISFDNNGVFPRKAVLLKLQELFEVTGRILDGIEGETARIKNTSNSGT